MGCAIRRCSLSPLMILLLFIFLSSFSSTSYGADTLEKGKSIRDGESLISAGEVFELGFFSPGSSKNRYVGIWYYSISVQTVVWVANKENPVRNLSGRFTLRDDGSLAVLEGESKVLWSSNTSSTTNDTYAQLLNTGNFMVKSRATGDVWQSFDHPGDTYLPGMNIGLDLRTNVNTVIVSSKSTDDPSSGAFTIGMDPRRSTQLMIWDGETPVWRSGPWDGQAFIGIQSLVSRPQYLYGIKFSNVAAEQKMYLSYTAPNETKERFVMTSIGVMEYRNWSDEKKEWRLLGAHPKGDCELFNRCGDHGICEETSFSGPICSCLHGFKPYFPEEWSKGNWSGGCSRRIPLECQKNRGNSTEQGADGFLKLERLKLPDGVDWIPIVDANACENICWKNCSCEAYAYVSGIGCMTWGLGLVDIQQFASGGKDLYIKLAGPELATSRKTREIVIIACVCGAVLVIICISILLKCSMKIKELFEKGRKEMQLSNLETDDEEKQEKNIKLSIYSFQTLTEVTSNFSDSNMIGHGGFGPVYKGVLRGKKQIAIKRLSTRSGQGMEEFKNEVMLISKLQHRNLVRLLGYCIQGEEKLLVYEYLVNKSLDGFLFDSSKREQLDWKKRLNIIGGIARGLLYLHRDSRLTIIHRDLKTSNILLDEEMNPKISDFGMARIFRGDGNPANTGRVVGTYGYMSPEYAMDGLFSVKSDVYSFGVVLLEVVSGMRTRGFLQKGASANLLGYAWTLWNEGKGMEFIDPSIIGNCSIQEALRCLQVGLLCVQDRPNKRPTMSSVIVMLESVNAFLPRPKQPIFTVDVNLSQIGSSSGNLNVGLTLNYITNTSIIGR